MIFLNNGNKRFAIISAVLIVVTLFLSWHVANLLFGTNSYEAYRFLQDKKDYLNKEIVRLQLENAKLQKEYFELKNLEPQE